MNNTMEEKKKDLITFSKQVISFRMNVIKACKEKNIEVPTDEQISDYINDYGLHLADFMADYIEHEGMFRCLKTPLEAFKEKVNGIEWGNKPSDEQIEKFFAKNGDNLPLFCKIQNIASMKPLERKMYFKTIQALTAPYLVKLWNVFIEESALYGEDSYIYDLQSKKDVNFLRDELSDDEFEDMKSIVCRENANYVQYFFTDNKRINPHNDDDIECVITAYWGEIFERILCFPSAYMVLNGDGDNHIDYFEEVVWPILLKEVGIKYDESNYTIEYIEKNQ